MSQGEGRDPLARDPPRETVSGPTSASLRLRSPWPSGPRADLARLWVGTPDMEFARGRYLYVPGNPSRTVFLVRSGAVRLARLLDSGRELNLDIATAGEIVGEAAALGEIHRTGLAQALGLVQASPLPAMTFVSALRRDAEASLSFAQIVFDRSRRLERRSADNLLGDCQHRLGRLLLEMAGRFGSDEAGGRRIDLRLTHEDIARFIGAARETVTPLLVKLRDCGAIDYNRRRILVRDRSLLGGGTAAKAGIPGSVLPPPPPGGGSTP